MTRRKASELSKDELVGMIATLRGVLYGVLFTPDDVEESELRAVVEATTFDNDIGNAFVDPPGLDRLRSLAAHYEELLANDRKIVGELVTFIAKELPLDRWPAIVQRVAAERVAGLLDPDRGER